MAVAFGSLMAVACGLSVGCGGSPGGGEQSTSEITFTATQDGSVEEVSGAAGCSIATVYDKKLGDFRAISLTQNGQTLSGELVYEVNGKREDDPDDSLKKTRVKKGDKITWRKL